ncbi:hypothetical protein SCLCIDRAFT_18307 [Scleroderma citrinum Foug A]|uniref:DNA 3'-5' helicase n=1 Tax=Scleroderma citrinum Foug A TaxID=1036808 RepID=A0A0C2YPW0_9AGAM|nr:hypothetical protein SCLCIDRAFT_18307 [Scleroderma citrinum Foug A]
MEPLDSVVSSAERDHAKGVKCLAVARTEAAQKRQYNSQKTWQKLSDLVQQHFHGHKPYDWQLDTAEALLLGLDSMVIAGTGAGKTLPFVMPLLYNKASRIIIISPLKALQRDQKHRFQKMGISAIDVNGETWNPKLRQDLKDNKYQAILIRPEMCLQHEGFRELMKSSDFCNKLVGIVVDEAHCISQWGGDFCVAYGKLGDLHSYVPTNVPILATSATLAPAALKEVQHKLQIDSSNMFFLNLGNDRPNITPSVIEMQNSSNYSALLPLIEHLPSTCSPYLDIFHALHGPGSKKEALKCFRNGQKRILIAMEAAGMGADIPDIELVIQFGVPSSLEVWTQWAGRAGRSPTLQARAVLLAERSMFQQKRAPKK